MKFLEKESDRIIRGTMLILWTMQRGHEVWMQVRLPADCAPSAWPSTTSQQFGYRENFM